MKKLFLILSLIGLVSLTISSCGAQKECRGRGDNYQIKTQNPSIMLAFNDMHKKEIN